MSYLVGFTTVSTRRGYYSDNNENALVMWAGNLKGELYAARLHVLRRALELEIAQRRLGSEAEIGWWSGRLAEGPPKSEAGRRVIALDKTGATTDAAADAQ